MEVTEPPADRGGGGRPVAVARDRDDGCRSVAAAPTGHRHAHHEAVEHGRGGGGHQERRHGADAAVNQREAELAGAVEVHRRGADGDAALIVDELRDLGGQRARQRRDESGGGEPAEGGTTLETTMPGGCRGGMGEESARMERDWCFHGFRGFRLLGFGDLHPIELLATALAFGSVTARSLPLSLTLPPVSADQLSVARVVLVRML